MWARITVSAVALALLGLRVAKPELQLDLVSLGLFAIAVLPWLSDLIKSAEIPGGWKVEFQEVKTAAEKVAQTSTTIETGEKQGYSERLYAAERDPNLALVGLRIDLERRIRALAKENSVRTTQPLQRVVRDLQGVNALTPGEVEGLTDLIAAGNKAAHGADVSSEAAHWLAANSQALLTTLDSKLKQHDHGFAQE